VADAVLQMGALLRSEFHRPGGPRGSGDKALIDAEIARQMQDRLLSLHACGWHSEEIPPVASDSPDTWVVDPQDGTRAFLKGLRGSAISVALVRDGVPVLGIVYAPTAPDDRGDFFVWAENLPPMQNREMLTPIGEAPAFELSAEARSPNLWPLGAPDRSDLRPGGSWPSTTRRPTSRARTTSASHRPASPRSRASSTVSPSQRLARSMPA
jgi:hypothetical protein